MHYAPKAQSTKAKAMSKIIVLHIKPHLNHLSSFFLSIVCWLCFFSISSSLPIYFFCQICKRGGARRSFLLLVRLEGAFFGWNIILSSLEGHRSKISYGVKTATRRPHVGTIPSHMSCKIFKGPEPHRTRLAIPLFRINRAIFPYIYLIWSVVFAWPIPWRRPQFFVIFSFVCERRGLKGLSKEKYFKKRSGFFSGLLDWSLWCGDSSYCDW